MHVQPNKAIVGANAFAHEAGIHQDGMLKHHETYEIMRPETVGATQSLLVLGKHSGRHAVKVRLAELGHALTDEDLAKAFARFKAMADKKKNITDADLEAIVADELYQPTGGLSQTGRTAGGLRHHGYADRNGEPDWARWRGHAVEAVVGTGPVDAAYKAIDRITGTNCTLTEFAVNSVTRGIDALGEVTVRIQSEQTSSGRNPQYDAATRRTYAGHGAATDIVVASAKAYLAAINKMLAAEQVLSSEKQGEQQTERPVAQA